MNLLRLTTQVRAEGAPLQVVRVNAAGTALEFATPGGSGLGGAVTLKSGTTFIDVTHDVGSTPNAWDLSVTPNGSLGSAAFFWIDTITSTTFRINVNVNPTVDVPFVWQWAAHTQVVQPPPAYSATVLADSPVGYWRLSDASGAASFVDSSGHGRTLAGSASAGNTSVAGATTDGNTAQNFTGGQALTPWSITDATMWGTSLTMEAWIKLASMSAVVYEHILGPRDATTPTIAFYLMQLQGTANLECRMASSGGTFTITMPLPDTSWHHVAMVYNQTGGTLTVYKDGALYQQIAASGTLGTSSPFRLGTLPFTVGGSNPAYRGGLDEVALYAGALSASRIAAHYAAR